MLTRRKIIWTFLRCKIRNKVFKKEIHFKSSSKLNSRVDLQGGKVACLTSKVKLSHMIAELFIFSHCIKHIHAEYGANRTKDSKESIFDNNICKFINSMSGNIKTTSTPKTINQKLLSLLIVRKPVRTLKNSMWENHIYSAESPLTNS